MSAINAFKGPSEPRRSPNGGTSYEIISNIGNFAGRPCGGDGQLFPTHCLPPDIAEFVRQAAEAAAVPVSMAAVTAIGVLAGSLGSGIELQDEGSRTTRGNLYLTISAPSGMGKDAIFNEVAGVFPWFNRHSRELWHKERKPRLAAELALAKDRRATMRNCFKSAPSAEARAEYQAAMINAEADCNRLELELKGCPVLCITEPSRVGMAMLLENQQGETCAIMTPEARGSVAITVGQGAGNLALYCSAYSGSAYEDSRVTRAPVSLKRPCLSILWMMQPDVLSNLLDAKDMVESGLLPRFLIVQFGAQPMPDQERRPKVADAVKAAWWERVRDLIEAYRLREKEPTIVETSEDALREFWNFRKSLAARMRPGGDLTDVDTFVRRWEEQAKRVALVLHAGLHGKCAAEHELSATTASDAIEIVRWFGDQQLELLHSHRFGWLRTKAEKLHKTLLRHPGRRATLGELAKSHCWRKEEVAKLVDLYPDLLRAEETPPGTRGKPTVRVFAV